MCAPTLRSHLSYRDLPREQHAGESFPTLLELDDPGSYSSGGGPVGRDTSVAVAVVIRIDGLADAVPMMGQ